MGACEHSGLDWERETGGARFSFLFKIKQKIKFSPSNPLQLYGFQTGPQISTNLYFHQTDAQYSAMRAAHPTLTYNTNLCIRGRILHLEPGRCATCTWRNWKVNTAHFLLIRMVPESQEKSRKIRLADSPELK